jgi:hypothetical protein
MRSKHRWWDDIPNQQYVVRRCDALPGVHFDNMLPWRKDVLGSKEIKVSAAESQVVDVKITLLGQDIRCKPGELAHPLSKTSAVVGKNMVKWVKRKAARAAYEEYSSSRPPISPTQSHGMDVSTTGSPAFGDLPSGQGARR